MTKAAPDFLDFLRVLSNHKVDFIIVGGVGAVLQGAPITTLRIWKPTTGSVRIFAERLMKPIFYRQATNY